MMSTKNDNSFKGMLDEFFPEDQLPLRKAYWNVLFNGASKLELSNLELSQITFIDHGTIEKWYNDKEKALPFSDLTIGPGKAIKQFMDLLLNLGSMYVNPEVPKAWLRISNPSLKNRTPLDFMSSDENGIFQVNTYLKSLGSEG